MADGLGGGEGRQNGWYFRWGAGAQEGDRGGGGVGWEHHWGFGSARGGGAAGFGFAGGSAGRTEHSARPFGFGWSGHFDNGEGAGGGGGFGLGFGWRGGAERSGADAWNGGGFGFGGTRGGGGAGYSNAPPRGSAP